MCTVSYIPGKDAVYITSNRDEKNSRKQAIPPIEYEFPTGMIIFPKDANAGGSWIALHENGNVAVLLNGAFEKHISNPPYKRSRGHIFIEIISVKRPVDYFNRFDFSGIEPFTMIIIEKKDLFECRWDGQINHCRQLRKSRHYIWSSATLYDKEVTKRRENWFAAFLNRTPLPSPNDIIHFHRTTGDGDTQNNLLMNRDGLYATVSITSVTLYKEEGDMKYVDLKDNKEYMRKIKFN
ncbi:MAG TPA: NRDE family protein [Puia sp.]|nr:NRDE family protein [Puia sp.]